ncbi:hypothetical protein YN1_7610 [Nanoarchaeota archaeon]
MIPDFEYFIEKGDIKRTYVKDINLAKSLLKTATERLKVAEELKIPKFKLEFAYESIIELIDAILSLDGYKSYSHIADISYLRKLGFSEDIILKLDNLRDKRHKSKYYGLEISEEEAKNYLEFVKSLSEKLIKIIEEKLR